MQSQVLMACSSGLRVPIGTRLVKVKVGLLALSTTVKLRLARLSGTSIAEACFEPGTMMLVVLMQKHSDERLQQYNLLVELLAA